MRYKDLTIGHRLGAGFGLLLVTLAALVAAVLAWQSDSAREQRLFAERIAPLSVHADELEDSILYVAIELRSYLLAPGAEQLRHYREAVDRARQALSQLSQHPMDADGERLYRVLEPEVQRYLGQADEIVTTVPEARIGWSDADAQLTRTREGVIVRARDFARLQGEKAAAALGAMAQARDRVSDGLIVASTIALLFCLGLAYFTTQSIRRPTRELVELAGALTAGDLKPALGWAPSATGPGQRPPRSEMLRIAHAFGAAAAALQRREQRLRAHRDLATVVASSLDREAIAAGALRVMVQHAGADVGVLYWKNPATDDLFPLAAHGVESAGNPLRVGEGIPGEAARSGGLVVSRDIPRDSPFSVKLGYDAAPPRMVAAMPVLFQGQVVGVILIAALRDLDDEVLSFLGVAGGEVGVGLQNAQAYEDIQRLLVEMQEKNERIEQQNQELQAQNEEIQSQHEEIQAQHEEIQSQSEELQSQNDQLRQHTEELEARASTLADADERKNEFLGFLAHELRNPTSAIANSLFVLARAKPGSDKALNAQAIMQRQTRQLTRLIDDLLDTTRISRGKIELDRQPLNFCDAVRECLADFQSAIDARHLVVKVDVPEEDLWVSGDRTRLCQVLGNLLSNAIKFSEDGQPISIAARADHARCELELRVIDAGCGIDPDLMPQLFKPFTQGPTSLARTKGGLGLGLALVKSLVEMHEGSVQAYSDGPGRGAEFRVRLPLLDRPVIRAIRPAEAPRNWRVLIIEDNADAAESLRAGAELQGYDVRVVHDGGQCLEAARQFRPQVVLCDIGLPGIDGYEVARRLRADPALGRMFLIAVSGYAAPQDKARAAAAGFDCHVAKPLRMEELEPMLTELQCTDPSAVAVAEARA